MKKSIRNKVFLLFLLLTLRLVAPAFALLNLPPGFTEVNQTYGDFNGGARCPGIRFWMGFYSC